MPANLGVHHMCVEQQRIEQVFMQLVKAYQSPNVTVRDVALAIDAATSPELTDVEFEQMKEACIKYVPDLRVKAIAQLWS